MPGQDKTGPEGKGPKTGRQIGDCEGATPIGRGFGPCGMGLRRGFGRGMFGRNRDFGMQRNFTPNEEKKILEAELKEIDSEKKEIEKRLKEIN